MTTVSQNTILLIEDDVDVAAYIKGVVETFFPAIVLHAASAAFARRLFCENSESIRAIISDLSLPGISGVSLVKELSAAHQEVGIVFVTGYIEEEASLSKLVGRKVSLVMKPFGPIELKSALEKYLAVTASAYEFTR